MTILWCGGEEMDFIEATAAHMGGGPFRPQYARTCVQLGGYGAGPVIWSTPFADVTSCWASAQVSTDAGGSAFAYPISRLWGLIDAATGTLAKGIYIGFSAMAGTSTRKLALLTWDGATQTVLAEAADFLWQDGTLSKLDLQVIDYGASSTLNLYLNAVLAVTFSGDCRIPGVASLNAVGGNFAGETNSACFLSELIVADEDTRQFALCTLSPTAAGDANAWTGAVTDINEVVLDDATFLESDTPGAEAQFRLSSLPAGSVIVKAVKLAARAENTAGAAVNNLNLGVKSGGVIDAGTAQPLTVAWSTLERLMAQNPVTASPWAAVDVNALQLNLRAEA